MPVETFRQNFSVLHGSNLSEDTQKIFQRNIKVMKEKNIFVLNRLYFLLFCGSFVNLK